MTLSFNLNSCLQEAVQGLNEYQVNSGLDLFVTTLDDVDSSTCGPDVLDLAVDGDLSQTSVKRWRKLKRPILVVFVKGPSINDVRTFPDCFHQLLEISHTLNFSNC